MSGPETQRQANFPAAKVREMALLALALGATFLAVNLLHFRLLEVSVILYACVVDAIVASILVLAPFFVFRAQASPLLRTEVALTAIAANLLVLLYGVMGPTVIDRSLSLYILEKLNQRGGAISQAAMPAIFTDEYLVEHHLVDVRLTEQVTSGTARIVDGCVLLTPRGRQIAAFTRFYRKHFLPRHRVLLGTSTDALTDPFRDGRQVVDTACRPASVP